MFTGFCELKHLRELDIQYNTLKGKLPECMSNLTSLERLDLPSNQFSGNISYIYTDNNSIYAETEMHNLAPRFQLNEISLSCCGDGGSFPQFLYHQHDLQSVDLSNIYFKVDQFPSWLLGNNKKLDTLILINNSLSGPFWLPFASHLDLFVLDVSNNFFNGSIPTEIGAKLPSLMFLNMSKKYFNGSIPSSFGDMSSLESLDLSNNRLVGYLNTWPWGKLFSGGFNLTNLNELQLDGNNFSGRIPNVLSNCSALHTLDLSNNHIFGTIPSWMGNMSSLSTLDLSKNHLFGRIPQWMGITSNLEQIAVADNHLEGPIPEEFCKLNH
ncbi:Leucine-rich repeat - like 10, partial [Theobroma cacao]